MKSINLMVLLIAIILNLFGCSQNNNVQSSNENTVNEDKGNFIPSLGGIKLGDKLEVVIEKLGKDYSEEIITDETGDIGEDMLILSYKDGIEITFGSNSKTVLFIVSSNQKFKTDLNISVSNTAKEIDAEYAKKFEKFEGYNSDGPLDGWYIVDEESVMIFDYKKSDHSRVNDTVNDNSKCEEIELAYYKYFD